MFLKKNFFYFIYILLITHIFSCQSSKVVYEKIKGNAQGSTYSIIYKPESKNNIKVNKSQIDSIFMLIDKSMSLWDKNSIISQFNLNKTQKIKIDEHFEKVLNYSFLINKESNYYFDPTISKIVKSWAEVRKNNLKNLNTSQIDSLKKMMGMDKIELQNHVLNKKVNGVELDFNAIAQGYTVDVLAEFLELNKIQNYMIEVGGELRTKGKNEQNENWKIGVEMPNFNDSNEQNPLQLVLQISDKSMATSGNYRNFSENNGERLGHIIDPKTGKSSKNNIISVCLIAPNCTLADAWATAFSLMDNEKSIEMAKEMGFDIQIISHKNNKLEIYQSENFIKRITN